MQCCAATLEVDTSTSAIEIQVPTRVREVTYFQNFVIIRVESRKPFSMLLGRPSLYSTKVVVDWGANYRVVNIWDGGNVYAMALVSFLPHNSVSSQFSFVMHL